MCVPRALTRAHARSQLHALFHLMCRWLVGFKAVALYIPAARARLSGGPRALLGCVAFVRPLAHRGRAAMCPLRVSKTSPRLGFDFQRQRYEHLPRAELDALAEGGGAAEALRRAGANTNVNQQELVAHAPGGGEATMVAAAAGDSKALAVLATARQASRPAGAVVMSTCPVDRPVCEYVDARGLGFAAARNAADDGSGRGPEADVAAKREQYGPNTLAIATPKFLDLYVEQLLSPIAMFQIFTSVLWLLDEYWQYTLFTLFSIFAMEARFVRSARPGQTKQTKTKPPFESGAARPGTKDPAFRQK